MSTDGNQSSVASGLESDTLRARRSSASPFALTSTTERLFQVGAAVTLLLLYPVSLRSVAGSVYELLWSAHLLCQLGAVVAAFFVFFRASSGRSVAAAALLVSLAVAFCAATALGMLPPTARDALIYQLYVPRIWLAHDRVVELSWHEWSHFPLAVSTVYLGFLKHGMPWACALYHGSYLFLTARTVGALTARLSSGEDGPRVSAALTLTLPLFLKLSAEPMSDLALAYFFAQFVLRFLHGQGDRGPSVLTPALFLGACFSAKYNALLAAVAFAAAVLLSTSRESRPALLRRLVATVCLALLIWAPWPVRNWLATGNPLYPFLGSVFGGSAGTPFVGEMNPLLYRAHAYGETWLAILLLPLRMVLLGADDRPQQFDGVLSFALLIAVLPLLMRETAREGIHARRLCGVTAGLYFVLSIFLFHALVRYQSATIPLLLALCGIGYEQLSAVGMPRRLWQSVGPPALIGVHLVLTLLYLFRLQDERRMVAYYAGEDSAVYLRSQVSEAEAAALVSANVPEGRTVYLLGTGNRYFLYDREVRGSYFPFEPLRDALRAGHSADDLRRYFRENDISFVMAHEGRFSELFDHGLTDAERAAWREFAQHSIRLVARNRPYALYAVTSTP